MVDSKCVYALKLRITQEIVDLRGRVVALVKCTAMMMGKKNPGRLATPFCHALFRLS